MNRTELLAQNIRRHKLLYYQGRPEISDGEYDELEKELGRLDSQNPVLDMVGSLPPLGSHKIPHSIKMLSLNKTYDLKELLTWSESRDLLSTYKIDGVSCSLIYQNGCFRLAKTRGDGSAGEDITKKILWMKSVPHKIGHIADCEIRGELYCREKDFFELSREMEERGLERPSSRRNIVAGLMGRKENLELCRYIVFSAFEFISSDSTIKTEDEKCRYLQSLGFHIPPFALHQKGKDIQKSIDEVWRFMSEGEYQVDGIVFSFNDTALHNELGETAHHPRYKMAFKFKGESEETHLRDIVWQVSRNGVLTPIGEVDPVDLSGATISKVTLHNYGRVKEFQLKKGDLISITRSGEVIPKFLSVVKSSSEAFVIPEKCPDCHSPLTTENIRLFCTNNACPAKVTESILYFISQIGIDDISSKRLEEMIKKGLVQDIPDLYRLKKEDLLTLDKVQKTLALKFVKSIEQSKKASFVTFLCALGIQGGAYNKCEKIVLEGFDTPEKIKDLTLNELIKVDSFAEKSAMLFLNSLKSKMPLIEELSTLGFRFKSKEIKNPSPIARKRICITGALSKKRSLVEKAVREAGGIVVSSVSKNTDILLTNEENSTSSKFKKAKELDIEIVSEQEFFDRI